jgi:transcriptional regulator with GAF, ATPase, and Fis domain
VSSKESQVISHQANERKHILKALETSRGKISGRNGAAELLDLHPNTLRYRIKKLRIHMDRRPKDGKS